MRSGARTCAVLEMVNDRNLFFGLGPKPIPKNCQNVETRKFKLGHFLKILYTSTHIFDVKGTKLKWKVSVSAKKSFGTRTDTNKETWFRSQTFRDGQEIYGLAQ